MAFICDDCKYIFNKKKANCPFCGGRVYNNTQTEQDLLSTGYSWAPGITSKSDGRADEVFDNLRQSFFNEEPSHSLENVISEVSPTRTKDANLAEDSNNLKGVDYFSQFSSNPHNIDIIPTVEPNNRTNASVSQQNDDPYEQELQVLDRQRQRLEWQSQRRSIFNFLANIRWRTVLRVLFILLLVIVAVAIWKMRYVIFSSILNFFISILPIALIVGILWYIFRSFFR